MRYDDFVKAVLDGARREAREEGSDTVEPQHLLLAIAATNEPSTGRVLMSVGLDRATFRAALGREFERSLAAAGVSLSAAGAPRPRAPRAASPEVGSGFRLVMERGAASAGKSEPLPLHLLLGIVLARAGTVPRALALAGVDREDLVRRIKTALATQTEAPGKVRR